MTISSHSFQPSQSPQHGPRIVFFTGGTALRSVSGELARSTHNAVHLVTPFDSGGSSAELRRHFDMPAVGDLRNRLVALADKDRVSSALIDLFAHRFPKSGDDAHFAFRLSELASGTDPLVAGLPPFIREVCTHHFQYFQAYMPSDFTLQGASLGNLLIAGGYLYHGKDLQPVLSLFSRLLSVRGSVLPVVQDNLHIAAELSDGTFLLGQHVLTGKEAEPISAPVRRFFLTETPPHSETSACSMSTAPTAVQEHQPVAPEHVIQLIRQADCICYPMGSFYSSVLAALLPSGIGKAIAEVECPKVYVPNLGSDPEEFGLENEDKIETLLRLLRKDAGDVSDSRLLTHVLLDSAQNIDSMRFPGMYIRRAPLATPSDPFMHNPSRVAAELISLAWG